LLDSDTGKDIVLTCRSHAWSIHLSVLQQQCKNTSALLSSTSDSGNIINLGSHSRSAVETAYFFLYTSSVDIQDSSDKRNINDPLAKLRVYQDVAGVAHHLGCDLLFSLTICYFRILVNQLPRPLVIATIRTFYVREHGNEYVDRTFQQVLAAMAQGYKVEAMMTIALRNLSRSCEKFAADNWRMSEEADKLHVRRLLKSWEEKEESSAAGGRYVQKNE
jgi:hypothetical protein